MTSLKNLRGGESKVDAEFIVLEAPDPRDVNTKFGPSKVANVLVGDDTGEARLALWGDDYKKVTVGDRIRVYSAYTSLFRGVVQINVGKFGKMQINPEVNPTV